MAEELDTWRVAHQLLASKRDATEDHIARFGEHCARSGMVEGFAFWRRVAAAVVELRSTNVTAKPN